MAMKTRIYPCGLGPTDNKSTSVMAPRGVITNRGRPNKTAGTGPMTQVPRRRLSRLKPSVLATAVMGPR
jgi:hypothetical protein